MPGDLDIYSGDLPLIKNFNNGDRFIVETKKGPGLLDFKDLIIGANNVTFYDRLSANYVTSNQLSSLSATVDTHDTILQSISGVNTDILNLRSDVSSLESTMLSFLNSINTATLDATDISTNINSAVGFNVVNEDAYGSTLGTNKSGAGGNIYFTKYIKQGSNLTDNTDIDLDDGNNGFFYKAKGAYNMLFIGSVAFSRYGNSTGDANYFVTVNVMVNDTVIYTETQRGNGGTQHVISFTTAYELAANDIVRLTASINGVARIYGNGRTRFQGVRIN